MNKTILVRAHGDDFFAACYFGDSEISVKDTARTGYELIPSLDGNTWKFDANLDYSMGEIEVSVHDGEVPSWFLEFVRNNVQDYDQSKSDNFYLFTLKDLYPDKGIPSNIIEVGNK